MINYETIKSVYDDKLTLMQWLNKVQEALKDATAVSFNVNKTGDATLTFSIVFDDGTELETEPIILEQGESVQSATLRNGHLILTLTNGDELDAGNMGAVSSFSIDANQHLIVTYQDGSTNDLGAIFAGNININGSVTCNGLNTPSISGQNGGTIAINSDLKCLDKIVDSQGRHRFIEGSGTLASVQGVHVTFNTWSLSGTHLMIVIAGYFDIGTNFPDNGSVSLVDYGNELPAWIYNKIVPLYGGIFVEDKTITVFSDDFTNEPLRFYVVKNAGSLTINPVSFTAAKVRKFRIEIDLIIDNA